MAFLKMKHVSKYFGSVAANVDVNLSVEKGEIHALLGAVSYTHLMPPRAMTWCISTTAPTRRMW